VHAPAEDESDNTQGTGTRIRLFSKIIQILLGEFNAKLCKDDTRIFK
jgi:hypothetical protein